MSSAFRISIKTLKTAARCTFTKQPQHLPKRSIAIYNGFNSKLFHKEVEIPETSSVESTSAQTSTDLNNQNSPDNYYVPKTRQTVYSAHDEHIETASPVNRMY
ncbi:hypothetical protein WICMUC_000342 [Wickerhamomyces mucosus]|uniref:Uncharacterized protein n=1 Tax=Wickerhamomyces mucosus TaxID=1378264 RepID=A0A9P8PY06_9ASCO|nr:hypothetical protein WICMUC_000342 [Wickerhamomyces mucosus]